MLTETLDWLLVVRVHAIAAFVIVLFVQQSLEAHWGQQHVSLLLSLAGIVSLLVIILSCHALFS